jgi:hypothetical protein
MNPPVWTVRAAQRNARKLLRQVRHGELRLPEKTVQGLQYIARGEQPPKEKVQ